MSDNHNETPENCTHDCSTCGEACAHEHEAESMQQPLRPGSRVDKVIAVVSGKGGTGKTSFTTLTGMALAQLGKKTLLLDCDIGLRNLDLYLAYRIARSWTSPT